MKKELKRDLTPYEIAKYLQKVEGVAIAPQRVYRDRKDGRLAAYRHTDNGKWFVKKADAEAYIAKVLSGRVQKDPAW